MNEPVSPRAELQQKVRAMRMEVGRAFVGQDAVVSGVMIALLSAGHVLLEGVPGLGKTLLVKAMS
ncbi:MAG: AAA family ATPase, partial [Gammaproteobacteria bacterium]|nr:AAA family ATPase [Gammaproteobacteria bacterium]